MLEILNRENPTSLSTLFGDTRFDNAVIKLQEKYPDLIGMPERLLRKEIKRIAQPINQDDSMIRMKFWFEYDVAMAEGRRMYAKNIYHGVMSQEYFWKYLTKPLLLAWMICPLMGYQEQLDEAVGSGLAKLREFLELPVEDPVTGKIDSRLMSAQMKIIAMLDMRKHGAYTQKIEQRNLNLHATEKIENLSMEEVDKRIKKIEASEHHIALMDKQASRPVYTVVAEDE